MRWLWAFVLLLVARVSGEAASAPDEFVSLYYAYRAEVIAQLASTGSSKVDVSKLSLVKVGGSLADGSCNLADFIKAANTWTNKGPRSYKNWQPTAATLSTDLNPEPSSQAKIIRDYQVTVTNTLSATKKGAKWQFKFSEKVLVPDEKAIVWTNKDKTWNYKDVLNKAGSILQAANNNAATTDKVKDLLSNFQTSMKDVWRYRASVTHPNVINELQAHFDDPSNVGSTKGLKVVTDTFTLSNGDTWTGFGETTDMKYTEDQTKDVLKFMNSGLKATTANHLPLLEGIVEMVGEFGAGCTRGMSS